MHSRSFVVMVALVIAASESAAQQATSDTDSRLKKLLKHAPKADANGDGVLTLEEGKSYIKLHGRPAAPSRPAAEPDVVNTPPLHADVIYGPHERNRLDLWLARSVTPTPLVVCIHGGGFRGGDKSKFHRDPVVSQLLDHGISVAALNYRLTEGGKYPYPASMHDCARAVQHLRLHAVGYNLDKQRFAATGGSAGGCLSLWLAFHEDLADPGSSDLKARESTRLSCAAPNAVPTSLEAATLHAWFAVPRLKEHPATRALFGLPASGEIDLSSPGLAALARDASPITHLTKGDPPVYLTYGGADSKVDENTEPGAWVHHPRTGIKLKERMDELGIPCYLEYRGVKMSGLFADSTDFLIRTLQAAGQSRSSSNVRHSVSIPPRTKTFSR